MFCPRPYRGRGQRDEDAGAKGEISKKGTHLDLIPIFEFLIIAGLITNKNLVSFTGTFLWIQKHGDLKRRLTLGSEEIPNSYPRV